MLISLARGCNTEQKVGLSPKDFGGTPFSLLAISCYEFSNLIMLYVMFVVIVEFLKAFERVAFSLISIGFIRISSSQSSQVQVFRKHYDMEYKNCVNIYLKLSQLRRYRLLRCYRCSVASYHH